MDDPQSRTFLGWSPDGFHELAYTVYGSAGAGRTVVCVHGLTGRGSDFEHLAVALADAGCRVVCPDVVGRGSSDWLADPARYGLRQYMADMTALVARLDVERVDWVGTSMGGLIGMSMAGAARSPVRSLVLNDIGPRIPRAALQRLATFVGVAPRFDDLAAVESYLRRTRAQYGRLPDEEWRRMAKRNVRPDPDGGYRLHYDPGIRQQLVAGADRDTDMWGTYEAIEAPVLLLRGEDSDLLLRRTAAEMTSRGPRAELIELPDCGHVPTLARPDQIEPIVDWLLDRVA